MNINQSTVNKEKNAIIGVFPTVNSFLRFKNDDPDISNNAISKIISFAYENELIKEETEKAFINFIENHQLIVQSVYSKEEMTFENLIEEYKGKGSVNEFIIELNKIANKLGMPKINASLISRLKTNFNPDTPKNRNCLRLLAYWICRKEETLDYNKWHYQKILTLYHDLSNEDKEEGVRIAFSFYIKDVVINYDDIEWLKSTIKDSLRCLGIYSKKFKYSATTAYLDLPRQGDSGDPRFYEEAILKSISLAHQIVVRWALSDHSSQQKKIIIAITAGKFFDLGAQAQKLLHLDLPSNLIIRLTNFAHLCAKIANVKAIFSEKLIELDKGNIISIFILKFFWIYDYLNYVPDLLNENMLPVTDDSYNKFKKSLYYPFKHNNEFKALSAIHKLPQNDILILEIVKVLFFRKRFHEANTIISIILSSNYNHIVARVFRMQIFYNLALTQSESSFTQFELFYERAIKEGIFIQKNCKIVDEEVFVELGICYYGIAFRILTILRKKNDYKMVDEMREKVFDFLNQAQQCFDKGSVFSTSGYGNRSLLWSLHIKCVIKLLKTDDDFFTNKKKFRDYNNIYDVVIKEFIAFIGWEDFKKDNDLFFNRVLSLSSLRKMQRRELPSELDPTTFYTFVVFLFDFNPKLTVKIINFIIYTLKNIRDRIKEAIDKIDGVYSIGLFTDVEKPEKCYKPR